MTRVIVTGATGLVGGAALRQALESPRVERVTVVGRRSTGLDHPKLHEVAVAALAEAGRDTLEGHDVALYCVGAYTGTMPDAQLEQVLFGVSTAFARALREASPGAAFCFLSGAGADRTERSRAAFARAYGKAENAILALGFPRTHVFRPGYIYPVEPRDEPNVGYRVARALWPALRHVLPNAGIPSDDLARAMLAAGLDGTGPHDDPVLENRDIRTLAARARDGVA